MAQQFVIESMMPDGPHWYSGQRKGPILGMESAVWSPYWVDAKRYYTKSEANRALDQYCAGQVGAEVKPEKSALYKDSRLYLGEGVYKMKIKYLKEGMLVVHGNTECAASLVENEIRLIEPGLSTVSFYYNSNDFVYVNHAKQSQSV